MKRQKKKKNRANFLYDTINLSYINDCKKPNIKTIIRNLHYNLIANRET